MIVENKTGYLNRRVNDYAEFISKQEREDIYKLAAELKGKNVVHLNSAGYGGGVAEILKTLVPLEQDLGIRARWFVLQGDQKFFSITKKFHNVLQGSPHPLTMEEQQYYLSLNRAVAEHVEALNPDVLVVHDPQPLAVLQFMARQVPAIARLHVDLSDPEPLSMRFAMPFLERYALAAFSAREYVPAGIPHDKVVVSPPAIDPLSEKNKPLSKKEWQAICHKSGIDTMRPLLVQVARFDAWKDPLGVIDTYQLVKKDFPDVQLALAGIIEAQDDPEAVDMLKQVQSRAGNDPDIHLYSNVKELPAGVDTFINALQRAASVVFAKSIREGFGLVVSEAMWKGKAVIGGDTTGIRLQIKDGSNGYIVATIEEAAKRALELLGNPAKVEALGEAARQTVREQFLSTRLLHDELRMMHQVVPSSKHVVAD
jgi:trehalose synthase